MKLRRLLFFVSLMLGGAGYIARNLKKQKRIRWWRVLWGVFLGVFLIVGFSVSQVFGKAESHFMERIDGCAVIFGAAVWKNDQPSWALSDRIQAGVELYERDQVNCLVLSGGDSTFGDHEVDVMARIAQENGISNRDIIKDYEGDNTLATINNLPRNISEFVFVSNDFHLARIGLMAGRKDIQDYHLHAAPYQKGRYQRNDEYFLREMAGYLLIMFGL